jgi:hypothetical protein
MGDEILYHYTHSIYDDRVYETYRVSAQEGFELMDVTSTAVVLFSVYPGFELDPERKEKRGNLYSIEMNKHQKFLTIAVGGEITDNRLTVGKKTIHFSSILDQGTVIRIFLSK